MRRTFMFLAVIGLLVGGLMFLAPPVRPETPDSGFRIVKVAEGLAHPWALAFLPDDRILVTERRGSMRIVDRYGLVGPPLAGVPPVYAEGQGGLLDVVLSPDFTRDRRIYFTYAEGNAELAGTAAAVAQLTGNSLAEVKVIFRQHPKVTGKNHFGSRLAFAPDGTLFIGLGDRFDYKEKAQDLGMHFGKIVHLTSDGAAMPDNPFVGRDGAKPEVWSYGHRNIQSLAFHPKTGQLWSFEHGARGGDELNIIRRGANYGWPEITYSHDYLTRLPLGEGTARADVAPPVKEWTPSFAPSGMLFYTGGKFPDWQGDLFVGALAHRHLKRLDISDGQVVGEENLLEHLNRRIRDVRQGPDGFIYVLTDEEQGQLLRLEPTP